MFCIFLFLTDFKAEKKLILCGLIDAEKLITFGTSDDFDRYTKMGLQIEPNDPGFLARNRNFMAHIMNMAELFDANFLKKIIKGDASFVFIQTI